MLQYKQAHSELVLFNSSLCYLIASVPHSLPSVLKDKLQKSCVSFSADTLQAQYMGKKAITQPKT